MGFEKRVFGILSFFAFAVMLLSFVSAATDYYYPTAGEDTTSNFTYNMTSSDLKAVSKSDDVRYLTAGSWGIKNEYVLWEFSPNIDSGATINDAVYTFEIQRAVNVLPLFELYVWKESASKWISLDLKFLPLPNDDYKFSGDLGLDTVSDINNAKLKIQAYDIPNGTTAHDLVEIMVDYKAPDREMPDCSVDYIYHKDTENTYNFGSTIYVNESGRYYIFGRAWDKDSTIDNVQYNRTSPNNFYFIYAPAGSVDNDFDEKEEEWVSLPNDPDSFVDGWHEVCCRASDSSNNDQVPGSCVDFCIDTVNPDKVENVVHSNPSECVSNYVNEAPEFMWSKVKDSGCAEIYYEVEVYYSNGTLYYKDKTETNKHEVEEPMNGHDYYIRVRAVDSAGNKGAWSEYSSHVWYDTENPMVEILSPKQGSWFRSDFNVSENDSDNLGPYKCEYMVVNNENEIVNWTEVTCNELLTVDVSEMCPEDYTCTVHKRVMDRACNMDKTYQLFKVDRTAPETTKEVSSPKYPGMNRTWFGNLIHWFVTEETEISFECDDGNGVGEDYVEYRINNGSWIRYNNSFHLGMNDGLYNVQYRCVDKLSNAEELQEEFDKLDNIPPKTFIDFGLPVFWRYRDWGVFSAWTRFITSNTTIELFANDSEVGVGETYFGVLVPCNRTNQSVGRDGMCNHEEWYGTEMEKWYESVEDCLKENEHCNITFWESKEVVGEGTYPYMFDFCGRSAFFDESKGIWVCPYEEPFMIDQDCDHKVCYYSEDLLENVEDMKCEVVSVDNEAPAIIVHNPTEFEATALKRCDQSVVVEVMDKKSGLDGESIYAELYDSNETIVRGPVYLKKAVYNGLLGGEIYEGLINTELPAGDYELRVYASDNIGNKRMVSVKEKLTEGIYVEYLSPNYCSVSVQNGGICYLGFNVCMRGGSGIKMWMDKLESDPRLVTPDMLGAMTMYGNESTYIGLVNVSDAGFLDFGGEINGKTFFGIRMDFTPNITQMIGGASGIDYYLEAHN